jgi:hypothetical protein
MGIGNSRFTSAHVATTSRQPAGQRRVWKSDFSPLCAVTLLLLRGRDLATHNHGSMMNKLTWQTSSHD